MLILSFARTTAALIARRKTVTRREWSDRQFDMFRRKLAEAMAAGEPGLMVQAWSASPHRKGKRVAIILVKSVERGRTQDIPKSDWEGEGFAYMVEHGILIDRDLDCAELWDLWRNDQELVTAVIRFDVVSIEPGMVPEMFFGRAA